MSIMNLAFTVCIIWFVFAVLTLCGHGNKSLFTFGKDIFGKSVPVTIEDAGDLSCYVAMILFLINFVLRQF